MKPWTLKYKPKEVKEVVGQPQAVQLTSNFVKRFPKVKRRAILLNGPTGVGKTSLAHALAEQLDYEIVELNASDFRKKKNIEELLGAACLQRSLFGTDKLIIIDEVDGISGRKDRGGVKAITDMIAKTNFPMILTANDAYKKSLKTLRKKVDIIEMKPLNSVSVLEVLEKIVKEEKVDYDLEAIRKIAVSSNGDLRAAINDLQMISAGKDKITIEDAKMWDRHQEEKMHTVLKLIFKTWDIDTLRETTMNMKEDLSELGLWLDQNIPTEYLKPIERRDAYRHLADANIFERRIRRQQHWRFLIYISALSTVGIQQAKEASNPKFIIHQRPELLLKMFIASMKRNKMKGFASVVGPQLHASTRQLMQSFIPYYSFIQDKNPDMADNINISLGL